MVYVIQNAYTEWSECREMKSELEVAPASVHPTTALKTKLGLPHARAMYTREKKDLLKTHQSCTLLNDSSLVISYMSMNPMAPL